MKHLAGTTEVLADNIYSALRASFLEDLKEEDNVTEFLVAFSHIAAGSDVSVAENIFSPKTHRLACAYKAAIDCFMELDELAGFEQFVEEQLELTESEAAKDTPQMHQKILEFPSDIYSMREEEDDG